MCVFGGGGGVWGPGGCAVCNSRATDCLTIPDHVQSLKKLAIWLETHNSATNADPWLGTGLMVLSCIQFIRTGSRNTASFLSLLSYTAVHSRHSQGKGCSGSGSMRNGCKRPLTI